MKLLLLFLVSMSLWGCKTNNFTQERLFKSAARHLVTIGIINCPNLTADQIRYYAEEEFDKNIEYDSLYVNVLPALAEEKPIYTVTGEQLIVFHFCSRKMNPSRMVSIDYDSLKQNVDHFWRDWN